MEQKKKKVLTLCMVVQDRMILLGMKKKGFGVGRWNGFGGKVEEGETIEQAAYRETKEEAGIQPSGMEKVGIIDFEFENDPKVLEVHIFRVTNFTGEPTESEEMKPQWFNVNEIPYNEMWSDDIYWLPLMLQGKKFKGTFFFDKPSTAEYSAKILRKEMIEVKSL